MAGVAGAFAGACLVAGAGLLVFADPAWTHGLGAVALLACAVTVFALAARPTGELSERWLRPSPARWSIGPAMAGTMEHRAGG